jgi:hypothetical protein
MTFGPNSLTLGLDRALTSRANLSVKADLCATIGDFAIPKSKLLMSLSGGCTVVTGLLFCSREGIHLRGWWAARFHIFDSI